MESTPADPLIAAKPFPKCCPTDAVWTATWVYLCVSGLRGIIGKVKVALRQAPARIQAFRVRPTDLTVPVAAH